MTRKIGLVLQGGGALGSSQAGVYEALASSECFPDWVAGISIGVIKLYKIYSLSMIKTLLPMPISLWFMWGLVITTKR